MQNAPLSISTIIILREREREGERGVRESLNQSGEGGEMGSE